MLISGGHISNRSFILAYQSFLIISFYIFFNRVVAFINSWDFEILVSVLLLHLRCRINFPFEPSKQQNDFMICHLFMSTKNGITYQTKGS